MFDKAVRHVEREKSLLDRQPEPVSPPDPEFAPWPDTSSDLVQANAQYHPAALFPNTRAAFAKRLLLRVLNVYTYRQILFNAAVVRILNRWDAALRSWTVETATASRSLGQWLNSRIARLEERRTLWEARLAGRVAAVEDRTAGTEADLAELASRARADRQRLDALEDSVRRLETLLERERQRDRVGASAPR